MKPIDRRLALECVCCRRKIARQVLRLDIGPGRRLKEWAVCSAHVDALMYSVEKEYAAALEAGRGVMWVQDSYL
jgi:hypothetical protein